MNVQLKSMLDRNSALEEKVRGLEERNADATRALTDEREAFRTAERQWKALIG